MRSPWISVVLLAAAGCVYTDKSPQPAGEPSALSSFKVEVLGVWQVPSGSDERQPLAVVGSCLERYENDPAKVPAEVRGTHACRYVVPTGAVEVDLRATAIGRDGQPLALDGHPVSFRVEPGDMLPKASWRTMVFQGGVAQGTTRVRRIYGDVTVWVEDAPPHADLSADGGTIVLPDTPAEPEKRTFATGVSPVISFQQPSIATMQRPDVFENISSPLVGQFLRIGEAPESGDIVRQSCEDVTDPNHGQPMTLLVTGADNSGFFVTDLTACRVPEPARLNENFGTWELINTDTGGTTSGLPEPDHYYPGAFSSLYVYNYSYPEGLYPGDLLWTLSGSVQEFTSTTQLTFPSWVVRESVRQLPLEQWNKYLSQVKPADISLRSCQLADFNTLFVTDATCGHNKRSMKMESLESALVRLQRVRLPQVFETCDRNGDKQATFFCETPVPVYTSTGETIPCERSAECGEDSCFKDDPTDPATWICKKWVWADCDPNADPTGWEAEEIQCNIDCTTGQGKHAGELCTERSAYESFGQVAVTLPGPGSATVGLDETLPSKRYTRTIPADWQDVENRFLKARGPNFVPGTELLVSCAAPARLRLGSADTVAQAQPVELAANTLFRHFITADTQRVQLMGEGESVNKSCTISLDTATRINVVFRDAVPDLVVDCREDDADATRAANCKALHAATFDVVGHLRQVQAARPRWTVLPRDVDDVCCHPGPGLACPAPIQKCK